MMNILKRLLRRPYWFLRFQLPIMLKHLVKWNKMKRDWVYYRRKYFTWTNAAKRREVMRIFRQNHGRDFDFDHPETLNEKISVRKLSDDPRIPMLADKYAVRDYVKETVGDSYLVPLLFVGKIFTEADFEKLPRRYVIKTTNASGTNILVFDKSQESAKDIVRRVRRMLHIQYGYYGMEPFYNKIPPRVIVEEMLLDVDGNVPLDYKFHCFPNADEGRGKMFIQVDFGRFSVHTRNFYDINWQLEPFCHEVYPPNPVGVKRPEKLDEMLEVARKLAAGWEYVRVDIYYTDGRIYFGEMTFTPGAGTERFDPPESDKIWGDEWK